MRLVMPIEDYVTDVPYVRGFEKNLSPMRIRACAALNGFRTPSATDFDFCELGCAQGDTLVALAASFPRARFVGVDLNPAHVETGRTLARGGDVPNVELVERDFEELRDGDLPSFDYVTAHGVLSWVSPQKRAIVIERMSRQLKDGGLACVSYNAMPGWAAVEPLRQLIHAGGNARGDSVERARAGVELARALEKAGAFYFEENPAAGKMLATVGRMSLAYVAHEYLHAHWAPLYFAQLAREMAARDLYFVGQLPLHLNYRDLAIPESMHGVFATIGDRVAFEGLKDFALNTYFRNDVFVKGRASRDENAIREYLDATPFGADGAIAREALLPNHTMRFNGPVFDALLPLLERGAASVDDLAPRLSAFDRARVRDAVLHLLLGERVAPMQRATTRGEARDGLAVPCAYNRWVLQRGFVPDVPIVLASEVLGNGVPLTMVEAAGLHCALERDDAARAAWLRSFVADLDHLVVGDRRVSDKNELEAIVTREAKRFEVERLPRMIELGVVTCGATRSP